MSPLFSTFEVAILSILLMILAVLILYRSAVLIRRGLVSINRTAFESFLSSTSAGLFMSSLFYLFDSFSHHVYLRSINKSLNLSVTDADVVGYLVLITMYFGIARYNRMDNFNNRHLIPDVVLTLLNFSTALLYPILFLRALVKLTWFPYVVLGIVKFRVELAFGYVLILLLSDFAQVYLDRVRSLLAAGEFFRNFHLSEPGAVLFSIALRPQPFRQLPGSWIGRSLVFGLIGIGLISAILSLILIFMSIVITIYVGWNIGWTSLIFLGVYIMVSFMAERLLATLSRPSRRGTNGQTEPSSLNQ